MTPDKRIKIAHKACELMWTGQVSLSCCALGAADGKGWILSQYAKNYAHFYDKGQIDRWGCDHEIRTHQRILAILFWATCPASIRKGLK